MTGCHKIMKLRLIPWDCCHSEVTKTVKSTHAANKTLITPDVFVEEVSHVGRIRTDFE